MHGSLLPRYRGRAPVNWAVLHGERETGATLHYMTASPDEGDIVAQSAVPILPDDTAREVFDKVTVAAEIALDRVLPALVAGTAPRRAQDPAAASYFGGRDREPTGPSTGTATRRPSTIWCARLRRPIRARSRRSAAWRRASCARASSTRQRRRRRRRRSRQPTGRIVAHCGGGGTLQVLALELDGAATSASTLASRFGPAPVPLGGGRR